MLSILIPVYNWDVRELVTELYRQSREAAIPFEILCFDDGSTTAFRTLNQDIENLEGVRYLEMPENLGRARIRNHLGQAAQFPYLLFMDCDSKPVYSDFIQRYCKDLHPSAVLAGGTVYDPTPPADARLYLRWLYGYRREQRPLSDRQARPYSGFTTHHFVVPKQIFERIHFEESLREYGHEDTLFGQALERAGIPVLHIDNPLVHLGLEPADVFLQKTEAGVRNLAMLAKAGLQVRTRLGRLYMHLKKYHLQWLVVGLFRIAKPWLKKRLLSMRPRLWQLDAYKLGALMEEMEAEGA